MAKNDNLGDFLTDIANAIRTKKESSGIINAQDFSSEILSIPSGGLNLVGVWEDYKRTPELKYDLNLTLAQSNLDMSGFNIDIYVGDAVLTQLYNDCVSGVINYGDLHVLNHNNLPLLVARTYFGDVSAFVGLPFPVYGFGLYENTTAFELSYATAFLVGDLTPLGMGVGISLVKLTTGHTFDNIKVYEKYNNYRDGLIADLNEVKLFCDVVYDFPLVITDSVTFIDVYAFENWTSNNHPLVIPNSVTIIGERAFRNWIVNNHPLVIPDSVTIIGERAFSGWEQVPYIVMKSETPPTLSNYNAFDYQNDAPIYVPDASVTAYKNATNWIWLSSRIFSINEK